MPRVTQSVEGGTQYSVAQAARELGISAVVLSRMLRRKRIEPADGEIYSLRQIVDSQLPGDSPAEKSLEAHAELLAHKARLTELEIAEKEGKLLLRDEAFGFLKDFMRTVYDAIYYQANLDEGARVELERAVCDAAVRYWLYYGWQLEPEFSFNGSGEQRPVASRREKWATMICCLAAEAKEKGYGRNTDENERRGLGQSGGGRDYLARDKRPRAIDPA